MTKYKVRPYCGCVGKYHPHGDSACYEAMVLMAPLTYRYPLVDGQGNWGPPTIQVFCGDALYEARLSKFSGTVKRVSRGTG